MAVYVVGEYLREMRTRRGYSQEAVSYNICTPATLSRIENGLQNPSKRMLDKLLERLGVETEIFDVFASEEERSVEMLLKGMAHSIADSDFTKLEKYITLLEKENQKKKVNEKQNLLWAKSVFLAKSGYPAKDVKDMLLEAIHMTLPLFDGETPIRNNLLTFDEIMIINGIAIQYARQEYYLKALKLGYWLKEYMEEKIENGTSKNEKYPTIVYNISNWLGKIGRYEEVLEATEDGINYCIRNGNLLRLAQLLFNKACALAELNKSVEAKSFFTQSITLFEVTKQYDKAQKAIEWCNGKYNINV